MKTQFLNGEEWPPSVAETGVFMLYPPNANVPKEKQFAVANPVFAYSPGKISLSIQIA